MEVIPCMVLFPEHGAIRCSKMLLSPARLQKRSQSILLLYNLRSVIYSFTINTHNNEVIFVCVCVCIYIYCNILEGSIHDGTLLHSKFNTQLLITISSAPNTTNLFRFSNTTNSFLRSLCRQRIP
jgi:hypothetical protein